MVKFTQKEILKCVFDDFGANLRKITNFSGPARMTKSNFRYLRYDSKKSAMAYFPLSSFHEFRSRKHIATCVSKPHYSKIFNFEVFAFLYSNQDNSSISDIKMSKFSPETRFFTFFHAFSALMLF